MHFPAKAAGTESPVRSKVVSFKRRFYHAIYQSFRPGNGGEPGLRLRCDGADARRRGRPAGGRHRRRCRGARYPQPQREGTSRQKRGQRDYPGGDGTARGIRKTRAGRGYDPRKDRSRQRHRVECGFVGRSGLGRERTVGTSLFRGAARGICDDGRGAHRRYAPCRQRGPCRAGRRGAEPGVRTAGHRASARPRGLFLRCGASRHRGQHQGGARSASPRGTPARCRDAVGQCRRAGGRVRPGRRGADRPVDARRGGGALPQGVHSGLRPTEGRGARRRRPGDEHCRVGAFDLRPGCR